MRVHFKIKDEELMKLNKNSIPKQISPDFLDPVFPQKMLGGLGEGQIMLHLILRIYVSIIAFHIS